jgi:hypothetical protein
MASSTILMKVSSILISPFSHDFLHDKPEKLDLDNFQVRIRRSATAAEVFQMANVLSRLKCSDGKSYPKKC